MEKRWSLYKEEELLDPLRYSSGKNQADLVKEIIDKFNENDIVFLEGMVGTGKSAVALNIAKELGRAIFSVSTKPLQDQYVEDYEEDLTIYKNGEPLKIEFIKGRNNFECPYVRESGIECNCYRCKGARTTADCSHLPCSVSIVDGELKSSVLLHEEADLSESELRERENLSKLKVAELCPYWSPLYNFPLEKDGFSAREYQSVNGKSFWNEREEKTCPFFSQFESYLNSDIIVYNSMMYEIESLYTERKPMVDLEIIDEADLFLDNLNMKTRILERTLDRTINSIPSPLSDKEKNSIEIINSSFNDFLDKNEVSEFNREVNEFLSSLDYLLGRIKEDWAEKKQLKIEKVLKFSDDASFIGLDEENKKISFFIPKPQKVLEEFISNSGEKILFMSATPHSKKVLRNVFGLDDFGYVKGETKIPGELRVKTPNNPIRLTSNRFRKQEVREKYHKALEECIKKSEKPALIHIHAYRYLPGEVRKEAKNSQKRHIEKFKKGEKEILFSTKLKRGMDLKGEKCRSVIIQKYPYPNLGDPYLQALKKRLGNDFWDYYEDMARRDLIQQIGRVVRSEDDWAEIWSPDRKVYEKMKGLRRTLNLY
ncbi:hypothetical protein C9439_06520 [archaeon SCG-AAA382B04]|nr:hypothetical protein C9439_06520 [archaeon SCG-AAA382B04]